MPHIYTCSSSIISPCAQFCCNSGGCHFIATGAPFLTILAILLCAYAILLMQLRRFSTTLDSAWWMVNQLLGASLTNSSMAEYTQFNTHRPRSTRRE